MIRIRWPVDVYEVIEYGLLMALPPVGGIGIYLLLGWIVARMFGT